MDTVMKDCNGTPLSVGDEVATATSARYAGSGLRTGKVTGPGSGRYTDRYVQITLESGRSVSRPECDIVKVAR